jgi:hypothetical protein
MSKYCLNCTAENADAAEFCGECGRALRITPRQRRQGIAFLLNELENLRSRNVLSGYLHALLKRLYLQELRPAPPEEVRGARQEEPARVRPPQPVSPVAVVSQRPATRPAPPAWLAEQQANLLLYLGAFLVVIAALVFVSYSKEAIGASVKMALLCAYTLAFLTTGVFCLKFPPVRQAGVVFFAVGALMVPLNFVGAYVFFHSDRNIDPTGLWLAGSITSALFYGAVSMVGIGRWYPVPAMGAIISAYVAVLALADAPPESYPVSAAALAALLSMPHLFKLGKISDTFGFVGACAGQVLFPLAVLVTAWVVWAVGEERQAGWQPDWPPVWLNISLCSAVFYIATAMLSNRELRPYAASIAVGAIGSSIAAIMFMVDAPLMAYSPFFVCVGAALWLPGVLKLGKVSEVFGEVAYWGAQVIVPATITATLASAETQNEFVPLWLSVSLCGAIFYTATAMLADEDFRPFAAVAAIAGMGSALGALLVFVDAPPEAYPGSFVALAIIFAIVGTLKLGRPSEVFGEVGLYAAHFVVPAAGAAALLMVNSHTATTWYLPLTGVAATLFYGMQAFLADRRHQDIEPPLSGAALAVSGVTAVSLVYALGLGREWYGPAIAIVAWVYLLGSEGVGPKWFGQRYLSWMALITIAIAWLPFEELYLDFPRHGAGVHFAAVGLYLVAARLMTSTIPLADFIDVTDPESRARAYRLPLSIPLVYAASVTLAIGFFHLLASLPAAEGAGESDLAWPYFGLSAGLALAAAATRWFWPLIRPHVYVVALGLSLGVLLSAADQQGQVALLLALYTGLSFALVLWEREPLALVLPAAYGFFAILAVWRCYSPADAFLPLALSALACALFAAFALLRHRYERWSQVAGALAFTYAVVAPVVAWVRLSDLAQPSGFVSVQHFEKTLLYETAAASVAVLAFLLAGLCWFQRRVEIAAGATALMMVALLLEIGHFRPDNVQAYTAPLGVYVLAGSLLALRLRTLPADVRDAVGIGELLGTLLILAPTFLQSFEHGAWAYGIILLVEGLALVGVAVVRRRLWLLGSSMGFVVADGLHYLFFSGGPALPNWVLLAIAGMLVMAAGTAILLGRDQWTRWQSSVESWWNSGPRGAESG